MLERILVPVDGSERAEAIFGQLRLLFSRPATEILVAHAAYVQLSFRGADYSALLAEREAEASRHVHELAQSLRGWGLRARGIVPLGVAEESILGAAARERATLIALTSHGRSGYPRWVFGSVAEKILQGSRVPVLLVRSYGPGPGEPGTAAGTTELRLRRVLVPIDSSQTSLSAVGPAVELAQATGAELVVLHVEEEPWERLDLRSRTLATLGSEIRVESVSKQIREAGVPVLPLTLRGDPASQILEAVERQGIDLVALATHGEAGSFRWPLGSVTQKVIRATHVPALVVRARKPAPARSREPAFLAPRTAGR